MKFNLGQESITLRGDLSLGPSLVSLKAMMKTLRLEESGVLAELQQMDSSAEGESMISQSLQGVLAEYWYNTSSHSATRCTPFRTLYGRDPPPLIRYDLEMVVEPATLLAVRPNANGSNGEIEVLIQWQGLPDFEATWEEFQMIQQQFPDFHLEDKVKVWAGGNVRTERRFTYSRRKSGAAEV